MLVPNVVARALARAGRAYTLHSPFSVGKRGIIAGRSIFRLCDWHRIQTEVPTLVGTRMQIHFPDMIQKGIYFCGVWEPTISAFIRDSLSEGDVFVDVGANIGYHTCLAAKKVGEAGEVHAIEASPDIARTLERNLRLNGANRVQIHKVAILDEAREVTLFTGPESALGISSVFPDDAQGGARGRSVAVSALPLHQVVDEETLYGARLIKVDVEGAEWPVFCGIRDRLDRFGDSTEWIFEVTPAAIAERGGSVTEMLATFANAGFKAYALENRYDIDWYVRSARRLLAATPRGLVRPLPRDPAAAGQFDVLFTRHSYPAGLSDV